MPDWSRSMTQTFEYYLVDPNTWTDAEPLDTVVESRITRDTESETVYYASLTSTKALQTESYVRIYLVTTQDGAKERIPLATVLVQTPSTSFDGKVSSITMDAYSPLLELRDTMPPIGYAIEKNANIMDIAADLCSENCRAPVIKADCNETLKGNFVATSDDTWLTFLSDLIANADYTFHVDELGRIAFRKKQDIRSLSPVHTYSDDELSILYQDLDVDQDFYGVPNTVEVVYSSSNGMLYSKCVNDDITSPVSTVSRGRTVFRRVMNPEFPGTATQAYLDQYAKQLLRNLSSVESTLRYSHGYTRPMVGECVAINYSRAGLGNVKVLITAQTIECKPGTRISETGVFTKRYYGGD